MRKLTDDIHWKPGAEPVAIFTPATTPVHLREVVKNDLDRDIHLKNIEKAPQGTPTTWQSRMLTAMLFH